MAVMAEPDAPWYTQISGQIGELRGLLRLLNADWEEAQSIHRAEVRLLHVLLAERDAEIKRLRAELTHLMAQPEPGATALTLAHDELKRLHAEITTWGRMWDDVNLLAGRVEALQNGTAIFGSPKAD